MGANRSSKGARWNKWDLHVHSPASIVHHYGPENEDTWKKFIADIAGLPSDIKVIGINDYFFIDGYRRVLEEKQKGKLPNIELILPVLELRIDLFAGVEFGKYKRPNLHIIFSDEIDADVIEGQFISALNSKFKLAPGLDGITCSGILTRSKMEEIGKKIKESIPEGKKPNTSDLETGFNNINFHFDDIKEVLDGCSDFSKKYLLAIGKTEWSEIKWSESSIGKKKDIINDCHLIFTASDSAEACKASIDKLKEEKVTSLLLDCSDAHHYSDSTDKDRLGNCLTWIKSELTFEGLKQVLYEYDTRVAIQQETPDNKKDYEVIEAVRFVDSSDKLFSSDWIDINPNLNSIIGGKSSGKSLLLYHIAKAIDAQRVATAVDAVKRSVNYNYEFGSNIDFEVRWRDGEVYKLSESDSQKDRPITYIPQLYLNTLAEPDNRGEKSDFKGVIENILFEDTEYESFFKEKINEISAKKMELHDAVSNYVAILERINQEKSKLAELGDKKAIITSIDKRSKIIENLRKESNFTDEQENQYQSLLKQESEAKSELEKLVSEYNLASDVENSLKQSLLDQSFVGNALFKNISDKHINSSLAEKFIDDVKNALIPIITSDVKSFIEGYFQKYKNYDNIIQEKKSDIDSIQSSLIPFKEQVKNQEKYANEIKLLGDEKSKLEKINKKQDEITSLIQKLDEQSIFNKYSFLHDLYKEIVLKNENKKEIDKDSEISLITEIKFNSIRFNNIFSKCIQKKLSLGKQFGDFFSEDDGSYIFDERNHLDNIKSIFATITGKNSSIKLNQGSKLEDALHALFEDYYSIEYDLSQKGDRLIKMSPGKRGIILFLLFLRLSHSTTPILIDQPEDNLDNRTVYTELNDFIKNRKFKRQIILVSHNANMVVSTDSETIIVANQNGQNKDASNANFQFEYVAGALENTFRDLTLQGVLHQLGIREHVCDILEGGILAFENRERKYYGRVK